ncbi:hypothetical protein HNQ56_001750 [Anaerotaenia torta]|uniref:carbohydrate binding domain-containing protein n=1 Tax=Anaerotaenia torta TaxID=433293 RepID=UPI003D1FB128
MKSRKGRITVMILLLAALLGMLGCNAGTGRTPDKKEANTKDTNTESTDTKAENAEAVDTGVANTKEDGAAGFLNRYPEIELDTSEGRRFETVFEDYIKVDGTKLMDGTKELKFASLNYPQATSDTSWEQANALKTIHAMGGKVTRTYTIPVYNGNNAGRAYVTGVDGSGKLTFNEGALNQLDSLLALANQYGVRVIIPLVDHWHWVGGMDGYLRLAGIGMGHPSSFDTKAWEFYTNPKARDYFKQMITHLMDRTNSVSGIKYKDDPAVLCWETGNEIAAYDETGTKFPQEWTTDIAAHLKSTGIRQLVLDGKMDATAESLKDPNVDILGSHYYTGHFPTKTKNDTWLSFNNGQGGAKQILGSDGQPLPGKPFILGEFGAYTRVEQVNEVFDAGLEAGANGMMMWSLRAHKDGYGYYFHPENPGNWAAYHWPGFPSGDYYDETRIVRSIFAYASLLNGAADTIEEARALPIPPPETGEAPLLYEIKTVGDIQWRGVVGGAWYEIERAEGQNPGEGDWQTIADERDYVYDSGRNWEEKAKPCIAGYHDETAVTGSAYSYRLRACNESGAGAWSNVVTVASAEHIVADPLDMIAVSGQDPNPTEIRNVYSYDHSENVTTFDGALWNASDTEGYIAYNAKIPMTAIEIRTKNIPDKQPRVLVSKDDITYAEVPVTGSASVYGADALPAGTYFARVYIWGNNACVLEEVKTVYTYTGNQEEVYLAQILDKNILLQDEDFNPSKPLYAHKSPNLERITDGGIEGLAAADGGEGVLIYKTAADMTSYRVIAYMKKGAELKVEVSADGVIYEKVSASGEGKAEGAYSKYVFADTEPSSSARYLRVTYPAGKGGAIVKSVEVGSGSKRIPMQDKAPVNVLEDGEFYFGSDARLNAAYTGKASEAAKPLPDLDFTEYDVLFAWVKGDKSGNTLTLSLTDKNNVVWSGEKKLTEDTGEMVKFDFKDLTASVPGAVRDFSAVKGFGMGIRGASGVSLVLDQRNYYTGNYGVGLSYKKGTDSVIYLDNIYVGSLTKVDDYEGYNGADSLLEENYTRNGGGGMLKLSLDPDMKSEGAYGLKLEYDYQNKGYAGATKKMDYLNLKDYDGFRVWYTGDGSGNSLTFQVKTSDDVYWEYIGYLEGTQAVELDIPFDEFAAPSWAPREGTLDKNLNIIEFSIYTNKVGIGPETGTIYFDDIRGVNFIKERE